MYYKQETYKYVINLNWLNMPADAPSGWYEIRVATNLKIQGGQAGMFFMGCVESGSDNSDIKYVQEYAPWYAPLAQAEGVYIGTPEVPDLYLWANETSQANKSEDIGFIGYAKHIQGMSETVAMLPQPNNPPAIQDQIIGSYIIRQVTE